MFKNKLLISFVGLLLAVLCFFSFSAFGATTMQNSTKANADSTTYTITFNVSEYSNPNRIKEITYYDETKPEGERVVQKTSVDGLTYTYDGTSKKIYLYNLVVEGYTFLGWRYGETFEEVKKAKKDETGFYYIDSALQRNFLDLEPIFDAVEYEITYNYYKYDESAGTADVIDGVTNSNQTSYTVEDEVTLEKADKEGYEFKGWFKDLGFTQPIEKIEKGTKSDLTFYGKFEVQNCVLEFAWGEYSNINLKYGEQITEDMLPQPTREGFEFGGWYSTAGFIYEVKPGYEMKANVTLYPKWIKLENPLWKPLTFGGMGLVLILSGAWFIVFKRKSKDII